jgi:hypothetical protein
MPASTIIENVVKSGAGKVVTVEWLLQQSPVAARETLILFLALTALVPGVSLFAGLILIVLAVPMLFAHERVWLPRSVTGRPISLPHLARVAESVLPLLRWQERMIPASAQRFVRMSRPLGALLIVALSATLLVPLPLSNVPPALAIAMIAVSYLEMSGILLAASALAGAVSLTVTGSAVWAALGAAHFVFG